MSHSCSGNNLGDFIYVSLAVKDYYFLLRQSVYFSFMYEITRFNYLKAREDGTGQQYKVVQCHMSCNEEKQN